jgi:hypothetical protein
MFCRVIVFEIKIKIYLFYIKTKKNIYYFFFLNEFNKRHTGYLIDFGNEYYAKFVKTVFSEQYLISLFYRKDKSILYNIFSLLIFRPFFKILYDFFYMF